MTILGAVIAGGASSRFGSDKAAALLADRTLLDYVIVGLSAQTAAIVICGRNVHGYCCLADRPQPGLGPLGGLAAALRHALDHGHAGVLTSACDTPLVPPDLALRLAGAVSAVVREQPLFGYWPATLSDVLDRFLQSSRNRSVNHWARVAGAREIRYALALPNINWPGDLVALRQGLASG